MSADAASRPASVAPNGTTPIPFTPAQLGLWLATLKVDDATAYAVAECTRLSGRLDIDTWMDAADEVLRDIPALRMRVVAAQDDRQDSAGASADGLPQVMFDAPAARAQIVDFRSVGDPDSEADAWISRALAEPLDPTAKAVSHAALLRTGDEDARWFLRVHHIAADGYGFALIGRQLARVYAQRLREPATNAVGGAHEGPDASALDEHLSVSADLRSYADSVQAATDRAHWLSSAPHEDPVSLAGVGTSLQSVRRPLNMTGKHSPTALIAALALLSGAVNGRGEAVVGVHMMSRQSKTLLRTVCTAQGLLPLRIELDPQQTLGALLDTIDATWESARTHQRYRHEDLRLDWGLGAETPLCDVSLNMVPFGQSLRFGEASGRAEVVWDGPAEGLCLDVRSGRDGRDELVLVAAEGSVRDATLGGFADILRALMSQIDGAERGDAVTRALRLEQLALVGGVDTGLSEGASRHIVPATAVPEFAENPIWAVGALDRPGLSDIADLVAPDRSLHRAQASVEVNRFARLLRSRGVGAGDRIVVHLPRTSAAVLAPVAVVQTGAAFVPCDAEWPDRRVADVIHAAGPALVITTSDGARRLRNAGVIATMIDIDDEAERGALAALSGAALTNRERVRPVTGEDPAYVLFTSGSTGAPKGVVVRHRNLSNFARTVAELYLPPQRLAAGRSNDEAVTCVHEHSFAFDSGLSPLVTYLLGHRLLVPSQEQLSIPTAHIAYLREQRPDVLDISPAVLEELLQLGFVPGERTADDSARIATTIFIGGDACSDSLWTLLREASERGVLTANAYGPTENTVDSTLAWIAEHPSPSIGRAMPRQQAEVNDRWGRVLPVGVVGELWVSGASVAAGYLNDAASTSARFVDSASGERSYRTGDLVRREPNGSLTFIGRADAQLSLRGVRIEAAEVEAALLRLPGARRAVAVVRDDGAGSRLIGYVVSEGRLDIDDARRRLRDELPAAFVPSALVDLAALPLTDRGKIDRRRLPAPSTTAGDGIGWDDMEETERVVAGLIAELLGIERGDLRTGSDLFALGGHSLTAARLLGRLGEAGYRGARLSDVFSASTVSGIAALVRDSARVEASHSTDTPAADFACAFALTDAQRRLWIIEQANGPSSLYSIPVILRVQVALDRTTFEAALADAVLEHLTLQCTYPDAGNGTPLPTQADERTVRGATALRVCDADPHDPDLASLIDTHFDIANELPIRAFIAEDGERQSIVIVLHHIAADGASLVPLMDSVSRAYRARTSETAEPAAALIPSGPPIVRRSAPEEIEWWQARLDGLPDAIELPLDRPRPRIRDHRGGALHRHLGPVAMEALQRAASDHRITGFMVMQAVLAGLLTRCGAGDDIPLGTISSGRATAEEDSIVAFLANTLVTRTDTSGDPTFAELIARVQAATLPLLERSHVPFDHVVTAVNPPRSTQHHPLFQVLLVAQNTDAASFDAGADTPPVTLAVEGNGTAKFDLTCEVFFASSGNGNARVRWEYATDIWDHESVVRLADAFERLLNQALTAPTSRLWSLPLDAEATTAAVSEARRMLDFRRTRPSLPGLHAEATLAGALDASMTRTPDAVALVDVREDGTRTRITYATLNERSQRIRDAVWAAGVGPGELVALLVPRSARQVEAVAGVVRSGAAYVPLDGDYPETRLAATIDDAKPALLLYDGHTPSAMILRALGDSPALDLAALPQTSEPVSPRQVRLEDPAYAIFTSGSTGRPKGVVIPQSHVPQLLCATAHWFGFGSADVWTLFHSYAFDFAVWEMFGALLTGGSLVIVPTVIGRSPAEFLQLLRDERVSVLNQTPSAFGQLVRADASAASESELHLRTIILGGEAMDPMTLSSWFGSHDPGSPDVINMYGITETTVHVTYQRMDRDVSGRSPVGEPIPDRSVYLLDAGGHPVPPGMIGEIYVGGAGVADRYIGRPDLTAQRFVADPFAIEVLRDRGELDHNEPVPRMYRSGDLAVRTNGGSLDFRGRADRQVQLRGFRIELGEVEAAALALPTVTSAHARIVHLGEGDDRLVVDLVGPDPATTDPVHLRREIASSLPAQMAPAAVAVLTEFPLTVNGKLDEAALPSPSLQRSRGRAPQTSTEHLVCSAFAHLLGIEECSADDSFFDLGGHSMLAVSLVAHLRERTGIALRVGTLLGAQTPALLAAVLDGESMIAEDADLEVLLPLRAEHADPSRGSLFCVHPAGGLSWCYAGLPRHLSEDLPVYGLQARGVRDPQSQPRSLSEMADDYIVEALRVQPEGPYHLMGWSLGGMVAQVMAARMQQRGHRVGLVALLDAYPSEAESGIEEPPLADALSSVLAMAGLDDDALVGRAVEVGALADILAEHASPMAGLSSDVLEALVRTYRNTTRILREYHHEPYIGDVLFFRAGRAGIGPEHDATEWAPHVQGALRVIDVDCTHREMTQPGPLAAIGAAIAAEIGN